MNIAIIQFPGSNCERETMLAVHRSGMTPFEFLWHDSVKALEAADGYIIVGGFSYEDRSRAGIIAALDPVMSVLKTETAKGKPLLGICNGAQILIESGLVPGFSDDTMNIALTHNKRIQQGKILGTGYYNAWIHLKLAKTHQRHAFTQNLDHDAILKVPVAHAEGRFVMEPALLDHLETHGLVTFQYCDAQGEIMDEFPVNPNGSVNNIAAISNQAGNVLAIMPHPERTPIGDVLFQSMRDYIATGVYFSTQPSHSQAISVELNSYHVTKNAHELRVELMITDNEAMTVENTLRRMGLDVTVQRQVHWEIIAESTAAIDQLQATGILYNDRKEILIDAKSPSLGRRSILVRAKEDLKGQEALQHAAISGISSLAYGVLWHFSGDPHTLDDAITQILKSNIVFNPCSHEGYVYA